MPAKKTSPMSQLRMQGIPRINSTLLLIISLLLHGASAKAQNSNLIRPADTSSPRATLTSLIDSSNEFHAISQRDRYFERSLPEHRALGRRVIDCLDDSVLPEFAREEKASEAAVCIKEVLDRVELPALEDIPDVKMIEAMEGGLDRWRIPGTRLTIVRIDEGPRRHEYLFSGGTVLRATEYYEDMRNIPSRTSGLATSPGLRNWYITAPASPLIGKLVSQLPSAARERVSGLAYWQWFGLTFSIVITLALIALAYRLQRTCVLRFKDDRPFLYALSIVFPILAVIIPLLLGYGVREYVSLRGNWLYAVEFAVNLLELCTSIILIFSIVNRVTTVVLSSPSINPKGLDAQFIRILSKILSLAISVIVFIEGGQYLGIPIGTLLASAGVGGLAVALAAQDTVKNLFGTIMLMADKPFRVEERIQVSGYDGIVEDIELRSTRIRLLNGHQVTIPNDSLASSDIENIGRRPFIRRSSSLRIPLDTPREKIEKAIDLIRQKW